MHSLKALFLAALLSTVAAGPLSARDVNTDLDLDLDLDDAPAVVAARDEVPAFTLAARQRDCDNDMKNRLDQEIRNRERMKDRLDGEIQRRQQIKDNLDEEIRRKQNCNCR